MALIQKLAPTMRIFQRVAELNLKIRRSANIFLMHMVGADKYDRNVTLSTSYTLWIYFYLLEIHFRPWTTKQSFHFAFLDHYGKVLNNYGNYHLEIEEAQTENALEYFDLQSDQVLVDVGGGTGNVQNR